MTDSLRYVWAFWNSSKYLDRLALLIRWNHGIVCIQTGLDMTKPFVQLSLLCKLHKARFINDSTTISYLVINELFPLIQSLGWERFDELCPPAPFSNLEALLIPPQYQFTLSNNDGITQLLETKTDSAVRYRKWPHPFHLCGHLDVPRVAAKDVDVISVIEGTKFVAQVRVKDEIMIAKCSVVDMGKIQRQFYGGLDMAKKAAAQKRRMNIPRIVGVIQVTANHSDAYNGNNMDPCAGKEDMVVGILKEFVIGGIWEEGNAYRDWSIWGLDVDEIDAERKKGWFTQVKEMVQWLHENRLIWGDSDIIIHKETDEAWLMGCWPGAVSHWDMEKAKRTDRTALHKLECFLGMAVCYICDE